MPRTPTSARASFTSSSLNGLKMASIVVIHPLPREERAVRIRARPVSDSLALQDFSRVSHLSDPDAAPRSATPGPPEEEIPTDYLVLAMTPSVVVNWVLAKPDDPC